MNQLLVAGCALAVFLVVVRGSAVLAASLAGPLAQRWRQSSWLAALALSPVALGSAAALSLLTPQLLAAGCHCLSHPHHPHLCFDHAAFSWALLAASAVAVVALCESGRAAWRAVSDELAARRWLAALGPGRAAGVPEINRRAGLVAGTFGVLRPRIVVGAELWHALDADSRAAVMAHEQGHVRRRDALVLALLRAAACLMPRSAAERLLGEWRLAAEMACDRFAARSLGDPCIVASALVACGRLQHATRAPRSMLAAADGDLELRVHNLLGLRTDDTREARGDSLTIITTAMVVIVAFTLVAGHETHHAAETLLGWLS